jgi:membrane fusion protein, multidrug efflux system
VSRLTAELERAQSGLDVAALEHARGKRLVEQRVISDQEFQRLKGGAHATRATLAAAAAALQAARLDLEFTRVSSPITGRVSRALIRPGNLVSSASLLTTVVSVDPIMAYFDVDERSYLALRGAPSASRGNGPAQNAVFLGLMNEENYPHQGRLDFLDNRLDPSSGTMQVRAVFSNGEGRFTPGLFARLKLVAEHSHPSVLIDERAVGTDQGKRFVLVLGPDQTLEYRVVTLGPLLEDLRVVERGLTAGDVIVVNGLSHVRAGMKVAPTQVAMSGGRQSLVQVASLAGTLEAPTSERQDRTAEGQLP